MVFEYCENGDLESYITKYFKNDKICFIPEEITQKIICQIAEAFKVMREKMIVHRDLKLANILVSYDYTIKLADFGFARIIEEDEFMNSYLGTPVTMAPEIQKR